MSSVVGDPYEALKAATCLIQAPGNTGTGYLVSAHRIVTCHHVIAKAAEGQIVTVTFTDRTPTKARVTGKMDRDLDTAVLDWLEPFADLAPLRFGRATTRKAVWDGYGYPKETAGQGLPIDGTIDDLNGKDDLGKAAFILTAGKFEAGTGAPAYGFSGSPVTYNGRVIGHLKRIVQDPNFKGNVAFGTVYAARAADFLEGLLPDEMFDSADTPVTPVLPPSAPAPAGEYDVLLSAAARDIPKAAKLIHALERAGKRVFCPVRDILPEQDFAGAIQSALAKSRAAIVVIGKGWTDALGENSMLWSWHDDAAHRLVTVLIDGASDEIPAPWRDLRPLDLRGREFADATLERLICALDGRTAPYSVVAADLASTLTTAPTPEVTVANALRLISVGNPRKALAILPEDSKDPNIRGARALALAKSKPPKTKEAIAILEKIRDDGLLDGETGGILGGRYREMWERTQRPQYLQLALDAYSGAFKETGDTYPGINTASLLLQLKRPAEAVDVATQVLEKLSQVPDAKLDHWRRATRGEARLILGDLDRARMDYQLAVNSNLEAMQDIAVMRRGARRALLGLGRDQHEFDDIFPVPRPMAFVGHGIDLPGQPPRFPKSLVGKARLAIRDALVRLDARLGVASATVGGDTLFIEELLEREGSARVLLPCPQGDFLNYFVPQPDRQYEVRKLLKHDRAEVIIVEDPADPTDVWADFAPRLLDHAKEWGQQLDETPLLLALWNGQPSYLESIIERWQEQNFDVQILYIRDGRVTTAAP